MSGTSSACDPAFIAGELAALFTEMAREWDSQMPDPLPPNCDLVSDCGCSSLDIVVFLGLVQRRFGRPLPFEQMFAADARRRRLTIEDVARFVAAHLSEG